MTFQTPGAFYCECEKTLRLRADARAPFVEMFFDAAEEFHPEHARHGEDDHPDENLVVWKVAPATVIMKPMPAVAA